MKTKPGYPGVSGTLTFTAPVSGVNANQCARARVRFIDNGEDGAIGMWDQTAEVRS